jgi:translocation protein SEC62
MVAQGDFLKDLYAGKLLPEKSQKDKENIDKPKLLSLDELLKKLDSGDDELSDVDVEVTEEEKLDSMMESLLKSSEELTEEE